MDNQVSRASGRPVCKGRMATCHPDRPRKTADGLCESCYRMRRYRTDPEYRQRLLEKKARRYRTDAAFRAKKLGSVEPRPYTPPSPRECDQCGATFTPKTSDPRHRFCSRSCRYKAWDYSRRATKDASERVPYRRTDIFERDGWKCGLCRDRIDPSLEHPHPLAASIDHIVPLSLGGDDTPANVQAAHLVCNCRKGDRGANEQLRLVG